MLRNLTSLCGAAVSLATVVAGIWYGSAPLVGVGMLLLCVCAKSLDERDGGE